MKLALTVVLSCAAMASAQSPLQLKVYTGRGARGFDVNSTIISGAKDMLVIDAQFSLSEAHRLVAEMLDAHRNLTTIYITHPHPDHYFGVVVLKEAFPNARIVAMPETVEAMKKNWARQQKSWAAIFGAPVPDPGLPEALTVPYLTLEGEQFPITTPVGGDGPVNSFVYIPSLKAVVAGDIVYDQAYMLVTKGKDREEWMKALDQIAALKPAILIPGHEGPGATHDARALDFMRKYIADWDANVASSKDGAELRKKVIAQYPGLALEFRLDGRIVEFFPPAK